MIETLIAGWVLFVLAAWPRLTWDDMEGRHNPMMGLIAAVFLPVVCVVLPFAAAFIFVVVLVTDLAPRFVGKWWSASWA